MHIALLLLSLLVRPPVPSSQEGEGAGPASAQRALDEALAGEGLLVDPDAGLVGLPARVLVRDDLLEYLLVGPRGATHESLFVTEATPSLLNAALLLLGVQPGVNARLVSRGGEESGDRPRYEVFPPEGDGFYLYAAWREADEDYLFRVEDLVADLATQRTLRRHRWVYLGSRFRVPRGETEEVFVADLERNLVSISFFYEGNTLLTARPRECEAQTIWVANAWLVPPRDAPVLLVFARERLERLPDSWREAMPRIPRSPDDGQSEAGG